MGKLVLLLVGAALMTVFVTQNPTAVKVNFLIWSSREFPLALIVVISALSGAVLTLLASLPARARRSREIAQLREERDRLLEGEHLDPMPPSTDAH